MLAHNQRYEAGEVSWWKKITRHYDMTMEEIERDLGLGDYPYITVSVDINDNDNDNDKDDDNDDDNDDDINDDDDANDDYVRRSAAC